MEIQTLDSSIVKANHKGHGNIVSKVSSGVFPLDINRRVCSVISNGQLSIQNSVSFVKSGLQQDKFNISDMDSFAIENQWDVCCISPDESQVFLGGALGVSVFDIKSKKQTMILGSSSCSQILRSQKRVFFSTDDGVMTIEDGSLYDIDVEGRRFESWTRGGVYWLASWSGSNDLQLYQQDSNEIHHIKLSLNEVFPDANALTLSIDAFCGISSTRFTVLVVSREELPQSWLIIFELVGEIAKPLFYSFNEVFVTLSEESPLGYLCWIEKARLLLASHSGADQVAVFRIPDDGEPTCLCLPEGKQLNCSLPLDDDPIFIRGLYTHPLNGHSVCVLLAQSDGIFTFNKLDFDIETEDEVAGAVDSEVAQNVKMSLPMIAQAPIVTAKTVLDDWKRSNQIDHVAGDAELIEMLWMIENELDTVDTALGQFTVSENVSLPFIDLGAKEVDSESLVAIRKECLQLGGSLKHIYHAADTDSQQDKDVLAIQSRISKLNCNISDIFATKTLSSSRPDVVIHQPTPNVSVPTSESTPTFASLLKGRSATKAPVLLDSWHVMRKADTVTKKISALELETKRVSLS